MSNEQQALSLAHRFVEELLGRGDITIAEELLSETVQAFTGLKPDGPINRIAEYKQILSSFFDAFPSI